MAKARVHKGRIMKVNEYGVYVSGFETIKVETKDGRLCICIGFNDAAWGWASSFLSSSYGWSYPLCEWNMVFPSRNDAIGDAVKKTIEKLQKEKPGGKYQSVIQELTKRHEPDQLDLFQGGICG